MPISPDLQAKINALPEKLKANILRVLNSPGKKIATNEQIFENMLSNHHEVTAQRALWRKWCDDEVLAFVEYFKQEIPEDYVEYLRQEREDNEIDGDLSWKVEQLSKQWLSGLETIDYILLLGKVRDHVRSRLMKLDEKS